MRTTAKLLIVGAAGVAGQYFLDPAQGARRRNEARDRAMAMMRRGKDEAARKADYAAGQVKGAVREAAVPERPKAEITDQDLARKVESIVFRDPDVPKEAISVDAAGTTVWLRGQVESQEVIDEVERATRDIPEVTAVENLLHTPESPAPTRADTPDSVRRDTSYSEGESPVEARAGMSSDTVREAEGDQKEE